jgi:tRNA 2-thiocytidine biosynthesis protein TtcA
MSPRQELFKGKIVIIRPLVYVEEEMIKRFAKAAGFPQQDCLCPNSITSNRTRITRMITELERVCPDVKTNIFRSVQRIKKDYLL